MAKKNQDWEEIVVKNGDYDNDESYEEVYPVEDYLKQDYSKKDDYQDSPAGYPTEDYPPGKYPGDNFPKEDYSQDNYFEERGKYLPVKAYPRRAFETPLAQPGYFDGEIYASVHEHGGYAPRTIIRADQTWGVYIKWKTSGSLVRMICGTWCVRIHLESIGPGPEFTLPEKAKRVPLTPCHAKGSPATVWYKCHIDIPAGLVPQKYCSTPYKLVTTLTYLEPCKYKSPGPIAAYVDGPLLQFFQP